VPIKLDLWMCSKCLIPVDRMSKDLPFFVPRKDLKQLGRKGKYLIFAIF
jgi:hypothetical protein